MRVLLVALLGACSFSGPQAAGDAGRSTDGSLDLVDATLPVTPDAELPDAAPTLTIQLNVGAPNGAAVRDNGNDVAILSAISITN